VGSAVAQIGIRLDAHSNFNALLIASFPNPCYSNLDGEESGSLSVSLRKEKYYIFISSEDRDPWMSSV
jgi:hypothetical protein